MAKLRFFPGGGAGLWGHEVYDVIEIEDGEPIICGVQFMKEPDLPDPKLTADPKLWEILCEDTKTLALMLSGKEGRVSRSPASRRAEALRSLHYERVKTDDGTEHWRRTLDRL